MRHPSIKFTCDYCGGPGKQRYSEFYKKKRHFCKRECYTLWRMHIAEPEDNNAWMGGISPEESMRRYRERNKAKTKAMANARKLRELNAPGSHTKADWENVKKQSNYTCAEHDESCHGSITKDHIIPLIMGGSNNPDNLQVLCRSHNSRKSRRVQLEFSK